MNIVTSKIPGERAKQYAAWLLYCEAGSLEKTLKVWVRIQGQNDTEMIPFFGVFLGKPVSSATLKRWSVKYRWQERTELKNTEDLEDMRFKFKRIKQTRAYKIAILLDRVLDRLSRQLDQGMYVSTRDLYTLWKMHRVEEGLSIGNYQVVTYQQPPTEPKSPEEIKLDKQIKEVVDQFHKNKQEEDQPTIT
ncbi:hypothetical protein HY945_03545 [Candidatus Gottesmanbacteria bacterium]|nr:hypothetical protein [Candidatus Gottesmanbacteria bacterium]